MSVDIDRPAERYPAHRNDEVAARLPAQRRYVGAVRQLTTTLAAQCELTVDEIEDLQMAVDEACALLLPHAAGVDPSLQVHFFLRDGDLRAEASVPVGDAHLDRDGLSWTVLSALSDRLEVSSDNQRLAISLYKRRGEPYQ